MKSAKIVGWLSLAFVFAMIIAGIVLSVTGGE
jgi:hypothetical protein